MGTKAFYMNELQDKFPERAGDIYHYFKGLKYDQLALICTLVNENGKNP